MRQTELIRLAWTDSGKVFGYRKLYLSRCKRRPGTGAGSGVPSVVPEVEGSSRC